MKILTFSNCPLEESQGSGYVILNYARGLRARGHEVTLLGPESFEPFRGLRFAKSHRQAFGMFGVGLYRILRERYDVIEFYGGSSCIAARFFSCWPRRQFLLVSHSNGLETHYNERNREYAEKGSFDGVPLRFHQRILRLPMEWAFRHADALVTVSDNDAAYARRAQYQDEAHILSLENPLPDSFLGQSVDFNRNPRVGFCGAWLPNKGIKAMRTAMPRVLAKFPTATFTLIGVGSGFRVEDLFPSEFQSRIEIIPFTRDKLELQRIYRSLSIMILPSIYESFGMAATEAMASGCALVGTNTGFTASLRHLEEAFLMDNPDAASLELGVSALLADDGLRRRLATRGYERVQKLRWDTAIERLEKAYKGWLSEIR